MMKNQNEIPRHNPISNSQVSSKNIQNTRWHLLESLIEQDRKWTTALSICANEESPVASLRPVMKALEISFHGVLWLLGTAVAFLVTHRRQDLEIVVNLFFLLILDLFVVGLTKLLFRRVRPSHNRMDMFGTVSVDLFSFPSGHATRAAMVAFFLIDKVVNKRFAPVIISFCSCVGISRIMLGRHHCLDVCFGFIIGILEYLMYLNFWVSFSTIEEWLNGVLSHIHM